MNPYQQGGQQPYGGFTTQPGMPGAQPGWNPQPQPPNGRGVLIAVLVAIGVLVIVIIGAGAFLFVHGSGSSDNAAPTPARSAPAEPAPVSSAPPPPSPAQAVVGLSGIWQGTYTCAQGDTALILTIAQHTDGSLTAIFAFSSTADNPVPSGSYTMTGDLAGSALELTGSHWLRQPAGYLMVDLDAVVPSPSATTISGHVNGSGCTTFSVRRSGS